MSRRLLLAVLLLAACAAPFAACGGKKNRPVVIASMPAQGAMVPGLVSEIEITYDEAVTILNPNDVRVSAGGVFIPVRMEQRLGTPCCVYLRPSTSVTFPPNQLLVVRMIQGAVINADLQYALEEQVISFTTGV